MKSLYKTVKVVYNAHEKRFDIFYRNWFFWQYDSCYKDSEFGTARAKELAIERAQGMLNTAEVWRQSNRQYGV